MEPSEQLQEELRRILLEQSESLKRQTFLGIDQVELREQERRIRHIRELFTDLLTRTPLLV